jgi:ABC-type uncharacterized transport system ATPase subunit
MTQPEHPAGESGQVVLDLHSVSKTFPGTKALDGVDLQVRAGEIHALVGQNGSNSGSATPRRLTPPGCASCTRISG